MSRTIAVIASVFVLLVILHDAFEVMLLPRRVKSRLRIVRLFFRFTWLAWSRVARRIHSLDRRHNYLSLYGPLSMVWLLVVWATGLIAGFGTLYWVLDAGQPVRLSWTNQIYFSGVTFFTLGYGDVAPHTGVEKLLVVLEAGAGLGFIAIVIGYLPVLYQLFARREAKVIMLDAAAGSPPSAVTLLVRHAEGESLPQTGGTAARLATVVRRTHGEPALVSDAGILPFAARQPVLAGRACHNHGFLRPVDGRLQGSSHVSGAAGIFDGPGGRNRDGARIPGGSSSSGRRSAPIAKLSADAPLPGGSRTRVRG